METYCLSGFCCYHRAYLKIIKVYLHFPDTLLPRIASVFLVKFELPHRVLSILDLAFLEIFLATYSDLKAN